MLWRKPVRQKQLVELSQILILIKLLDKVREAQLQNYVIRYYILAHLIRMSIVLMVFQGLIVLEDRILRLVFRTLSMLFQIVLFCFFQHGARLISDQLSQLLIVSALHWILVFVMKILVALRRWYGLEQIMV